MQNQYYLQNSDYTNQSYRKGHSILIFRRKLTVEKACRLTGDLCTNSWISNRPPRNLKPIHHNDYNMCITNTSNLGCPSTPKRNTKILVAQNKPQTDSRSITYPTNADELVPWSHFWMPSYCNSYTLWSIGEPGMTGTKPRPPKTGRMKALSNLRQ